MKRPLTITIPGLAGDWTEAAARYDYATNKSQCPICGGLGMPWAGWFSCEDCDCVALVSDGRAFVRATE